MAWWPEFLSLLIFREKMFEHFIAHADLCYGKEWEQTISAGKASLLRNYTKKSYNYPLAAAKGAKLKFQEYT